MLQITVPEMDFWDEITNEFIYREERTLQLEHSLVSLSKWESKWHKPFLSNASKTYEETVDYIKCMNITPNVDDDDEIFTRLSAKNMESVGEYISESMTATRFSDRQSYKTSNEQVTAELIYYWMIVLTIPFECQYWHLNRLLTLIRVCNVKNQPAKKMSKRDIMNNNRALNEARRKQLNTKG